MKKDPTIDTVAVNVTSDSVNATLHERLFVLPGTIRQLSVAVAGYVKGSRDTILYAELLVANKSRMEVQQQKLVAGMNNLGTFYVKPGDKLVIRTTGPEDAIAGVAELYYRYER